MFSALPRSVAVAARSTRQCGLIVGRRSLTQVAVDVSIDHGKTADLDKEDAGKFRIQTFNKISEKVRKWLGCSSIYVGKMCRMETNKN